MRAAEHALHAACMHQQQLNGIYKWLAQHTHACQWLVRAS
jgi:hypothetical protein